MSGGPPLWVVGGTVHLFGVTPGARGDAWLTREVRDAFDASHELWVEAPPDLDVDGNPLLQELGLRRERETLSPAVAERLEAALDRLGLPPRSMDALRPWVIVQLLDRMRLDRARIDPANDVEHVLVERARALGMAVRAEMADADGAIRAVGEGPLDAQEEYLGWTLDLVEGGDELVEREFGSWRAGDLEALQRAAAAVAERYPAFYRWLVTPRNEAWVLRIRAMLDEGRRGFVAPGLGHLVGPDSVLDHLAAAGVDARLV